MRVGDDDLMLPQKAFRPVPDTDIGRGRRFRDPDEQSEIETRVVFYTKLVAERGHITRWLPRRGNGSCRERREP